MARKAVPLDRLPQAKLQGATEGSGVMSQQPTRPEENTVDEREQTPSKEPLWKGLCKSEHNKRKLSEEEVARWFYKPELDKLDELNKDERDLANLPPAVILSETQKRKAEAARIQKERKEILDGLKRDEAYDILFGGAELEDYRHQSGDAVEGSRLAFYRNGDYWTLGKKAKEISLKHLKGLELINYLLKYPNREIACLEVYHCGSQLSGADNLPECPTKGADKVYRLGPQLSKEDKDNMSKRSAEEESEIVDKDALSAVKDRLAELEVERAEIEENPLKNPLEALTKKEAILEEISQLEEYIDNATTYGGAKKRFATAREKARRNVQKLIKKALEKIEVDCPDLKPFLNKRTIRTGKCCRYSSDPENTPEWLLDKPAH